MSDTKSVILSSRSSKPLKVNERVRPGNAQLICASFSQGGHFLALGGADHFVRSVKIGFVTRT